MKEFILLVSFLIVTGLVGTAETGGSMLQLLWTVPIIILDFKVIEKELEK